MDLPRRLAESIEIAAAPEAVYDLVADVVRTGEWSRQCRACEWDDPQQAGVVGAMFTGHNETPTRQWTTRSQVVVADRPREFAWEVGPGFVRWGYELEPTARGTRLTESWHFLDGGIAMFHERFGERAEDEIEVRTRAALEGVPATLERLKQVAEGESAGPRA